MTNSDDGLGRAAGPYGRRQVDDHDYFGLDAAAARVASRPGYTGPELNLAPERTGRHAMVESHDDVDRVRRREPAPEPEFQRDDDPYLVDVADHDVLYTHGDDDDDRYAASTPDHEPARTTGSERARRPEASVRAERDDDEYDEYDEYEDSDDASDQRRSSLTEPERLDDWDPRPKLPSNGGADLGLLILRLVLAGVFITHGLQKVAGLFGGPGIDGFADYLTGVGFQQAEILAWVTGVTEVAGGALLVLGLATPLAAAGLLAVMANAVLIKFAEGFLLTADGGFEYEVVLAGMAAALLFAGPGRVALDNGRGWFRHPLITGFSCLAVATGAGAAVYFLLR
ncbi:DoxX family protein [Actinoalloteichus hymeniacidonis]|uniref:Membrane protein n=1 Tax=Actinoalloteichus hymeniacidonis TaxID=340345 RepID=A0AAC9HUE8_9PSEU|nr:DoxX family protein [Actinoalloteichus hymeniacidonis]AOS65336.1 putative membrane protein [Actinoalloteichus hymeniacidonis]MBB5906578.1 putative membrane protein YphA (DoxX/SURF4 family) [Actinoalloteichus hymeniacidonis]